jgi:hypothetical protein
MVIQSVGGPGRATWEMVLADAEGVPIHAGTFAPRMRWGKREIWFRLPPIPDSEGKVYRCWIRKLPGGGKRDILVYGSRKDTDPRGNLTSGRRDRRGDLSLSIRYRTPNPALLPLPTPREAPWFASEPMKVLAFLLSGLVLVLLLVHLGRQAFGERIPGIGGCIITGIILVLALVGGDVPGRFSLAPGGHPLPPDDRQYDLVEESFSPHTEIQPGGGIIDIPGEDEPIIFMHPERGSGGPPTIRYRLDLPDRPVLSFTPCLREGAIGAEFILWVGEEEVWRSTYTPEELLSRKRVEIDLSPWEGKSIDLILGTGPAGHPRTDWVGWGGASVTSRRLPQAK